MIVIQRVSLFYGEHFSRRKRSRFAVLLRVVVDADFLHHVRVIGSVQAVCKYLLTDGARLPAP